MTHRTNNVCTRCEGSGEEPCRTCDNQGTIDRECTCGSGYISCDTCGGSGEEECSECYGTGEVTCDCVEPNKCDCRVTDGVAMMECPECEGSGTSDCSECGGDSEIECSACEGWGHINEDCPECDGMFVECALCGGDGILPVKTLYVTSISIYGDELLSTTHIVIRRGYAEEEPKERIYSGSVADLYLLLKVLNRPEYVKTINISLVNDQPIINVAHPKKPLVRPNNLPENMQDKVFKYLENLRESGVTNMFGASPYLQTHFGFSKNEADTWLLKWMNSYSPLT